MAEFTRKTNSNGVVQYRNKTENKFVGVETMETKYKAVKEELDIAEEGTVIDSETITQGEGDGVVDADGNAIDNQPAVTTDEPEEKPEPAEANPYKRNVPASEEGFGFPRKGGKTVDIFDGKTPHTHIRLVENLTVPLSEENYKTKTDAEIYDQLKKLKLV